MPLLIKRNNVMLPNQVSDFFNTGKLFPNRFDYTEGLQGMNSDTLITLHGQGHNGITDNVDYRASIKNILANN